VTARFSLSFDKSCERVIIFAISASWDGSGWTVIASVDDEDSARDDITQDLWASPEYKALTLDVFFPRLDEAFGALAASKQDPRVAAALASLKRGS
jgi:hypothetical protein